MRLIDADNISFYCNYEGDCTGDIDDCKECKNYICDFRDIQEHLIAYDIDKVVEELKLHSFEFGTDSIPAHYVRLNDAIEIVNQGGTYDDVCEWRSVIDGEFIQNTHTKRLYSNEPSMQNVYCNTCGKKIKIVGD